MSQNSHLRDTRVSEINHTVPNLVWHYSSWNNKKWTKISILFYERKENMSCVRYEETNFVLLLLLPQSVIYPNFP